MIIGFEQLELFEEWRQVVGYEGLYEVSNWGRLRGVAQGQGRRFGRLLNPWRTSKGYLQIGLIKNKIQTRWQVHRLVAVAFLGPCPPDKQIHHIDGDKTHNSIRNLRYVTQKEHSSLTGTTYSAPGEKNPAAKLEREQVLEIRRLYLEGMTQVALAKEFGVTQAAIWYIVKGKHWKHV
jgi:HNH endonuclease/NUMOD4 motif-containing protein